MHTQPFARYVRCLSAGDWDGVADLMLDSAEKLAKAGAGFLICPDNTIHHALPKLAGRSPLPWLHIADPIVARAREKQFRCLALTGTRWTLEGDVYRDKLAEFGIECQVPQPDEGEEMHRIIMDELVHGVTKPESVRYFERVIRAMAGRGCDAVILGCTEIPLIVSDVNSALPALDSTRLLASAALRRAAQAAHA